MENFLLAKDKKTKSLNLNLYDHTKMVINLGMCLGQKIYNDKEERDVFFKNLMLSLLLHDIGKISDAFQSYMQNKRCVFDEEGLEICPKKNEDFYYHNMISWAYASKIFLLRKSDDKSVLSSILWHHMCHDREDFSNRDILGTLTSHELNMMNDFYNHFLTYSKEVFNVDLSEYNVSDEISETVRSRDYAVYVRNEKLRRKQTNIEQFYKCNERSLLIRTILIYADRFVSAEKCDLEKIYNNDTEYMLNIFEGKQNISYLKDVDFFSYDYNSERLLKQKNILDSLKNNHTAIKACAGFGKTLLGLMWFFSQKKRLLWVVPRNIIAESTYYSVMDELNRMSIADKIKVGLFYGGQLIRSNCEVCGIDGYDILITNIDSVVKCPTTNNKSDLLLNMYTSNVIFDEYHEFLMEEPIFAAFIHMMRVRSRLTPSKSLLLSATALNFDCIWGNEIVEYKNNTDILYGDTKVLISIKKYNNVEDIVLDKNDNRFIITYTVPEVQKVYRTIPNNLFKDIIHARYTVKDRNDKTEKILKNFGKNKQNAETTLIGTNIIGTGLNISCREMYDFVVSPESTIQRCCGRASRFGEYDKIVYNVCGVTKRQNPIIENNYTSSLHEKWFDKLNEYDGKEITKNDLYELYELFNTKNADELEKFYVKCFNCSFEKLCEIPVTKGYSKTSDTKKISKGLTYRGYSNNVFATAYDDNGEWSDPVTVDLRYIENDEENVSNNKDREKAMRNNTKYTFPSKQEIKYRYGGNYSLNSISKIAKDEKYPLPLFAYGYNKELGLYKK